MQAKNLTTSTFWGFFSSTLQGMQLSLLCPSRETEARGWGRGDTGLDHMVLHRCLRLHSPLFLYMGRKAVPPPAPPILRTGYVLECSLSERSLVPIGKVQRSLASPDLGPCHSVNSLPGTWKESILLFHVAYWTHKFGFLQEKYMFPSSVRNLCP